MKKYVGKDAYVDPGDLVVQFLNKSEAAKALQKSTQALDDFYAFILMIASNQYAENVKFERRKAQKKGEKQHKKKSLDLNYDLLLSAFKCVISS